VKVKKNKKKVKKVWWFVNKLYICSVKQIKQNKMKNFNEYTKAQVIKSVQNNMTDSEGTQDYLESLTKDELRTLLIQFIVNK